MQLTELIQLADNMTTNEPTYWTVEDWQGERYDIEKITMQEAHDYAQDRYIDYCEENKLDDCSEQIKLINFYYNDEGEPVDIHVLNSVVEVEEDCGSMYEQHNTLWMENR